tara:strand:+ start:7401 stop:8141 length:741 start_codon:yes stop_codon:yes gene_type:complete
MLEIGISGSTGRMGKALIKAIVHSEEFNLLGGVGRNENENIGEDLGKLSGVQEIGVKLLSHLTELPKTDVLIDFSEPSFSLLTIQYCVENSIPLVLGTTGFDKGDRESILQASKSIPILKAPNTSIGIALLKKLIDSSASSFSIFEDIKVTEKHHKDKKDLPSGTSLDLVNHLKGTLKIKDSIDIFSERTGDISGEHKIIFSIDSEKIEISHKTEDRSVYAEGALRAAKWLYERPKGLYSMSDIYS